jgi:hypothetical protein
MVLKSFHKNKSQTLSLASARPGTPQSFYCSIEKISIYILNCISRNTIHIYDSVGNHVLYTLCIDTANIQLYKQKSIVINKKVQLTKIN